MSSTRIAEEIESLWAVDNHTHMARLWRGSEPVDFEKKASSIVQYLTEKPTIRLKVGGGALLPLRGFEYSEIIETLKILYGYSYDSLDKRYFQDLLLRILESRREGLAATYSRALDKARIEVALVNTPELRPELDRRRFKWVPFVDQFLYPLKRANKYLRAKASWTFERFERELDYVYQKRGEQPESLEDYLSLVEKELREYREKGAVAVKVWSAFFRPLHFRRVDERDAVEAFRRYMSDKTVAENEYVKLQDFIAWRIFSTCMKLNLPIHVHVGFGLANDVITLDYSNPLNLENLLKDRELEELKIVLIHGGYPFIREAAALARMNDNCYLDFSWLPMLIPPRDLSFILREWLAWKLEDRILFGTDAVEAPWGTDDLLCVYGSRQARKALEFTLSETIRDHVLTEEEAVTIAHKILRDNALELYKL